MLQSNILGGPDFRYGGIRDEHSCGAPPDENDLIPQIAETLGHIDDHPNIDVFVIDHPDPNRALSSSMAISLSRALPSRMASTIASNS